MKDYKHIEHMRNLNDSLIWERMKRCYDYGYEDGKADTPFTDTEEAEDKAYNRGLDDAWEAARKIVLGTSKGGHPMEVLHRIFSFSNSSDIFRVYDVTDAIARIKAYEDKQKQDAEIKVGDEVIGIDSGKRAFIIDKKNGLYRALAFDGIIHEGTEEAFTKTGKHFNQLAKVLKEMRGAENDE